MRLERRARPLRARAPKGERAFGEAPRNRGKNTTLLASMSAQGMGPCVAVEGATTGAVFEAYVGQVLAPALRPGQVVVLDNLAARKGERVKELVEARGCELLFLPAYSPDFSPIEEAFSKLKALLRRAKARTKEALVEEIGRALGAIAPEDAKGWFGHCAAMRYEVNCIENCCVQRHRRAAITTGRTAAVTDETPTAKSARTGRNCIQRKRRSEVPRPRAGSTPADP